MKSLSEIERERQSILAMDTKDMKPRAKKQLSNQLAFLTLCRNYLESEPSEQFCKDEIVRLKSQIKYLSEIVPGADFYPPNYTGNHINYFNDKMGIDKMRESIKTIEFILDC